MFRYLCFLVLKVLFLIVALVVTPILPLFAKNKLGKIDNAHGEAIEPRLPNWLSWFMTLDNSLWGDKGWQTIHHPNDFKTYSAMVAWLYRNSGYGFSWIVLAHKIDLAEIFTVKHSGNWVNIDKGQDCYGWFYITTDKGAFQFRWCKVVFGYEVSLDFGWLLDIYVKDENNIVTEPLALFQLSPRFSKVK